MKTTDVQTLAVKLADSPVGYLTHYHDGKNIFVFDEHYIEQGSNRSTLSLSFSDLEDPKLTLKRLQKTYVTMHALPSFFSNLLPEGSLKDYIISQAKVHANDEFTLLKILGDDLAGNIQIQAIEPRSESQLTSGSPDITPLFDDDSTAIRFSLAGVQMKFSMKHQDNRFTISRPGKYGDYIVKTPSSTHKNLPENEYSMMKLAQAAGATIPEILLININELENLPPINLPDEKFAYAIKRFDREQEGRIHIEDFAQVLGLRSQHKYQSTNYDTMARVLYSQSKLSSEDIKEFITRITVNILLGNTDAHIKNWSLIYDDRINPRLAPAYDIVSSLSYISDRNNALNFGRVKYFYDLNQETVDRFIRNTQLPAELVNPTIEQTVERANDLWPQLITELPIPKQVIQELSQHLKQLQAPFMLRI